MIRVLPAALTRGQRGVCPHCGVPLPLFGSGREVSCEFCGGVSVVQHRLRRLEPEVEGEGSSEPHWHPLVGRFATCRCAGCGGTFEADTAQAILACEFCGGESKIECRLWPITAGSVEPPERRTRADFDNQRRGRIDHPWDVQTEQLVWRILNEPDDEQRLALADDFRSWTYINRTAAHFLPWLLEHLQRDNEAVALAAGDVIGKLLCEGDGSLVLPVVQACESVIYDVDGKQSMLSELALGPPVCVKSLLDAAEHAASLGAADYACHALWGVNTVFGRHFDHHERMAEIVLYRMFWLTGPVLGWAMYMLRSGFHSGLRLPWRTLLQAIDDFADERPVVIPALKANIAVQSAESAEEFRDRLTALCASASVEARAAAAEILFCPPGHEPGLYSKAVEALGALLDDPVAERSATLALRRFIEDAPSVPGAVLALVSRRRESLPYQLKRVFINKLPDTELLDTSQRYFWQSEPKEEPTPEEQGFLDQWQAGIVRVVDEYRARVSELRLEIGAARKLDVHVLQDDGPPTIALNKPQSVEVDEDGDALDEVVTRLNAEFNERLQELSQQLMDPELAAGKQEELATQIRELGEELRANLEDLLG